jgi:BMFP domain-containing protein YqiC
MSKCRTHSPDQQALAALEQRVAKLEAANQGTDSTLKK